MFKAEDGSDNRMLEIVNLSYVEFKHEENVVL